MVEPISYLDHEQVQKLLGSIANDRDKLLAQFLYESGCSLSEATDLEAKRLHADGTIEFPDRTARISAALASHLLKQAGRYIFHSRQSESLTPKRVQQLLKPYLQAFHKSKVTPHLLRYSHIINAYRHGLDLAAISEQTGLGMLRLAQIVGAAPLKTGYDALFGKGGRT